MQKPRAQIINFENNRNINKSIVFVSLLIHYFAACICSKLWYVMGKEALNLSSALRISPIYVLPSLTDVVLVSLYSIIILFINQITAAEFHFPLYAVRHPSVIHSF